MGDERKLARLAGELLEWDPKKASEAVYEAGRIVESDFSQGWSLTRMAFAQASTDLQLQYIGACLLEPLIQTFPEEAAANAIAHTRLEPRFVRVLASVRLTGVPRPVWQSINEALAAAGVPQDQLVDWSTIIPISADDE